MTGYGLGATDDLMAPGNRQFVIPTDRQAVGDTQRPERWENFNKLIVAEVLVA